MIYYDDKGTARVLFPVHTSTNGRKSVDLRLADYLTYVFSAQSFEELREKCIMHVERNRETEELVEAAGAARAA